MVKLVDRVGINIKDLKKRASKELVDGNLTNSEFNELIVCCDRILEIAGATVK